MPSLSLGWTQSKLPGAAFLVAGAGVLLAAPLGASRHFYPDVGWARTVAGSLALAWGPEELGLRADRQTDHGDHGDLGYWRTSMTIFPRAWPSSR